MKKGDLYETRHTEADDVVIVKLSGKIVRYRSSDTRLHFDRIQDFLEDYKLKREFPNCEKYFDDL